MDSTNWAHPGWYSGAIVGFGDPAWAFAGGGFGGARTSVDGKLTWEGDPANCPATVSFV